MRSAASSLLVKTTSKTQEAYVTNAKTDDLEVGARLCMYEWPVDDSNPSGTKHCCYLDLGHDGLCVCGRCNEGQSH